MFWCQCGGALLNLGRVLCLQMDWPELVGKGGKVNAIPYKATYRKPRKPRGHL
jgi:hypothetical protein